MPLTHGNSLAAVQILTIVREGMAPEETWEDDLERLMRYFAEACQPTADPVYWTRQMQPIAIRLREAAESAGIQAGPGLSEAEQLVTGLEHRKARFYAQFANTIVAVTLGATELAEDFLMEALASADTYRRITSGNDRANTGVSNNLMHRMIGQ